MSKHKILRLIITIPNNAMVFSLTIYKIYYISRILKNERKPTKLAEYYANGLTILYGF